MRNRGKEPGAATYGLPGRILRRRKPYGRQTGKTGPGLGRVSNVCTTWGRLPSDHSSCQISDENVNEFMVVITHNMSFLVSRNVRWVDEQPNLVQSGQGIWPVEFHKFGSQKIPDVTGRRGFRIRPFRGCSDRREEGHCHPALRVGHPVFEEQTVYIVDWPPNTISLREVKQCTKRFELTAAQGNPYERLKAIIEQHSARMAELGFPADRPTDVRGLLPQNTATLTCLVPRGDNRRLRRTDGTRAGTLPFIICRLPFVRSFYPDP